ncbi:MFS transporter [Methylomarinum vadi]|uniref:MFS transporter n=1 Tax=Methylomarinum vadi TaxID=438855 RepID=UPI000565FDB4|nr:MFS transporter [Methylomarinum vadi]
MSSFKAIYQLLLGIALIMLGISLLGTLLALRARAEGYSLALTGTIMSSYFIGYVAGSFIAPPVIKRVGHIRAFAAFAAMISAVILVYALWLDPWVWALLRVVTGIGMIGIFTAIESWLNVLAPNRVRGRIFAVYMTVVLLSLAAGQYLILVDDIRHFTLFAIAAMFMSLGLMPVALTRVEQPPPAEVATMSLQQMFAISALGMLGVFVAGLVAGAFWGMGPLFAVRVGLNEQGVAAFMGLFVLGGALLQWPIGGLSDRFDRRKVLLIVSLLGTMLSVANFFLATDSHRAMLTVSFFCGGAFFSTYSLSVAHFNDHLQLSDALEASRGLLLLYGIGSAVSPVLAAFFMAWLGDGSFFLYCALAFVVLTLIGWVLLFSRKPEVVQEQNEFIPMVRTSATALEMLPETVAEQSQNTPKQ